MGKTRLSSLMHKTNSIKFQANRAKSKFKELGVIHGKTASEGNYSCLTKNNFCLGRERFNNQVDEPRNQSEVQSEHPQQSVKHTSKVLPIYWSFDFSPKNSQRQISLSGNTLRLFASNISCTNFSTCL